MATVKKHSKNMIRGSWFGNATVTLTYLANNVVGFDLVQEYREALNDISHLYDNGDDLNRLIIGQAPVNGMDAKDVPKQQRFCKAVRISRTRPRKRVSPCNSATPTPNPTWSRYGMSRFPPRKPNCSRLRSHRMAGRL